MFLKEKHIYLIIILLLVIIYIKKRNCRYGYKNMESFEVECNEDDTDINEDFIKKEEDEEYIRIIKCDTKKLKTRVNNLHKYYIYKLLETVFLKKTEINVLSLLVKNKEQCGNECMLKTKRTISLLRNQVSNLEKIINDFEVEDKDNFIKKQLICITKNNKRAHQKCITTIKELYYNDTKSDEDIKKECIEKYNKDEDGKYTKDDELCKKPAKEIRFIMSKNKCIESHKINEKECIEIPEEIEFMTQSNISKYIKDLEEQIKQQEPKLNRFLCYTCIKKIKDKKEELSESEKAKCKEVCKDIVEDIQERKKEDYEKQKKLFLAQQQQMNEYYEKQYKQNDGITSKTLKKIFNGEDAVSNSSNIENSGGNNDIYDIYKNINYKKHTITEIKFNEIYTKINDKVTKNIKLNEDDLKQLYILFNNNNTNKYMGFLSRMLRVLKYKNILTKLKNQMIVVEEEEEYETESNENRAILSHTGYNKNTLLDNVKKEFTIPNLPEFYNISKIQKDLNVNYMDLHGSPLPTNNNIYNSKYQTFSF
jgi:hypothetical protein